MEIRSMRLYSLIVALLGVTIVWPIEAAAQRCNSEARQWVEAVKETRLPQTYEEISRFPVNYRRAIYSTFSPERKSALWRTHLERHLEATKLTGEQRDVLLEALQLATPDTFAAAVDPRHWKSRQLRQGLTELHARALSAFGDRAEDVFATLGPPTADKETHLKASTEVGGLAYCNCSEQDDYCDNWGRGYCKEGGCRVIEDECGTFWMFRCDGLCSVPNLE